VKRLLLASALVFLTTCTGISGKRLTLGMKNTTDVPIAIVATYSVFSRTIILYPGQTWDGWVPLIDAGAPIKVEIRHYSPPLD
jgi:hypothetical protein